MRHTDAANGIRAAAGTTAAAIATIFLAGAAVMAQQPQTPPQGGDHGAIQAPGEGSASGTINLASRLPAVSTAHSNALPPVPGATANGVLPSAVYTATVVGMPDAATLVLRRDAGGPQFRVGLYGVAPLSVTGAEARKAWDDFRKQVVGQTVRVQGRAPGRITVYLLPSGTSASSGAALAAGATGGGQRPPVVLRPYSGSIDPSGAARDLSAVAPAGTAANPAGAVPQDRPLALPGGTTLTLNEGVIRSGLARYDARRAPDEKGLAAAEEDARRAGRGAWAATLK
jgi:hypothetical protein